MFMNNYFLLLLLYRHFAFVLHLIHHSIHLQNLLSIPIFIIIIIIINITISYNFLFSNFYKIYFTSIQLLTSLLISQSPTIKNNFYLINNLPNFIIILITHKKKKKKKKKNIYIYIYIYIPNGCSCSFSFKSLDKFLGGNGLVPYKNFKILQV